ncbi:hypothetical protein [Massilia sp. WF1]|uniref:hypothetical protein n=1 Tax=Massilia sp. WF1 TaxID=1406431 RepID=UPI000B09C25E|nr:hypothetical protein [Massilia sp. WF1]
MTSTLTTGSAQQHLEGRTVRDIVEHDPVQVNEVWCRKIFRQLLQSLELQYAMHMPHRAITPDTVVFHDNGEPLLLPSELAADGAEQGEAADLTALARVVHYAITRELIPAGPLRGRAPEGYSESLITAVDRCMSANAAERPRTVDELRHILGIVSLGPSMPGAVTIPAAPAIMPAGLAPAPAAAPAAVEADALPSFMHAPAAARTGGLTRWQRWAIAAGGAAVLLAIALAVFAELRDSGSYDHIVLTLPQSGDHAQERPRAAEPVPPVQAEPPPRQADANDASGAASRRRHGRHGRHRRGARTGAPERAGKRGRLLQAADPALGRHLRGRRRPRRQPAGQAPEPGARPAHDPYRQPEFPRPRARSRHQRRRRPDRRGLQRRTPVSTHP